METTEINYSKKVPTEYLKGLAIHHGYSKEVQSKDKDGKELFTKEGPVMEDNPQTDVEFALEFMDAKIDSVVVHETTHPIIINDDLGKNAQEALKEELSNDLKQQKEVK